MAPPLPGGPLAGTPPSSPTGRTSATLLNEEHYALPRLRIVVEREAGQRVERTHLVDGELLRIGSHPSNNVVLDDPLVSRFHCRLFRGATWRISDSGSLNGTRVAGVRVRDADLLFPECRIELGGCVLRIEEAEPESQATRSGAASSRLGAIIGASAPMRRLFDQLTRVGNTATGVLIEGESGTGKELVAAEIVRLGPRAKRPFIVVDCGAISRTLIESELFGHAKGAFTGAQTTRIGAFEAADGGTVFLDEIGELPIDMQPKLLRVIEAGEVRRIGENQTRQVNVRVIAATNRNLEREVNNARFREDLFFRLSVITLRVPPLRERLEDLPLLVGSFLEHLGAQSKHHLFTPEVFGEMARHVWPGNVRELRNFVERTVVFEESWLHTGARNESPSQAPPPPPAPTVSVEQPFKVAKDALIDGFEREYLVALLAWSDNNVSRAARKAGLDRMYLHRLLQKHGLRRGASLED
jgi:transcriptional regulator with GAF, ATPase, and Fis domain